MNILAIVPARGGSKGIPGKNMVNLNGKPLMQYTFDAAKESKYIDRILLSTDDEKFAEFGRSQSIEVEMRPEELATDTAVMKDVINYHLDRLAEKGYTPDIFILLQPTSPLRTAQHIDEALKLLIEDETADAIVSVMDMPHQYLPMKIMKMDDSGALKFYQEDGEKYTTRQALPHLYARNGAAIYAVYTDVYRKTGSLYGTRCLPYVMEEEDSVDIDKPFDLFLADCILKSRQK